MVNTPTHYTVHEPAPAADVAVIDAGLSAFNHAQAQLADVRALHVLAKDAQGTVLGGAVGRTWGACCELQQLWVDAPHRAQGVGGQLLALFEQAAARRHCTLVYLDTFSFQAPAFYAKHGYRIALQTQGFTGGICKYTLHKVLGQN